MLYWFLHLSSGSFQALVVGIEKSLSPHPKRVVDTSLSPAAAVVVVQAVAAPFVVQVQVLVLAVVVVQVLVLALLMAAASSLWVVTAVLVVTLGSA